MARPARAAVTQMVELNSAHASLSVTGNGLVTLTEDLARRFISIELDAGCGGPGGSRAFPPATSLTTGFRRTAPGPAARAALTIWRWGRHYAGDEIRPAAGRSGVSTFGAAGAATRFWPSAAVDPVMRIETVKARDPNRRRVAELFNAWWETPPSCKACKGQRPCRRGYQDRGSTGPRSAVARPPHRGPGRHSRCRLRPRPAGVRQVECCHLRTPANFKRSLGGI